VSRLPVSILPMASPRSFFDAQAQSNRSIGLLVGLLLVALVVLLGGLYALGLLLNPEPKVPLRRSEMRWNANRELELSEVNRVTGEVRTTTFPNENLAVPEALRIKRKPVSTITHIEPEVTPKPPAGFWRWEPAILFCTVGAASLVIVVTCWLRFKELARGGDFLAISLGGRLVPRGTQDLQSRQYLNIVEEMALASQVPLPKCYVLETDPSVNAFTAGRVDNFVVGVTRGALDRLSRDELQALVAHQFSLIDRNDMRLNLLLIGIIAGLLVITKLGFLLLRQTIPATFSKEIHRAWIYAVAGGATIAAGFAGAYFARVIQAAIARQRALRADAAAVQYTRYPGPLLSVLQKAAACTALPAQGREPRDRFEMQSQSELDEYIYNRIESQHLFFHSMPSDWDNVISTHPTIDHRIKQLAEIG
jgi:Zn-dependent protease with chaperone function